MTVSVLCLFLTVAWVGLQCVIAVNVFPGNIFKYFASQKVQNSLLMHVQVGLTIDIRVLFTQFSSQQLPGNKTLHTISHGL